MKNTTISTLFVLFLSACRGGASDLSGTSVIGPKNKNQNAQSQPVDRSFLGSYDYFQRPPKNLLLRQGEAPEGTKDKPAPLTAKHWNALCDYIEISLQTQLTQSQKTQLRDALLTEYDAGGKRQEGALSVPLLWAGAEEVYKKAPKSEKADFFVKLRSDLTEAMKVADDQPYRRVIQGIIASTETVVVPGEPALTKQHLESLVEATEFLASVYLGKSFTFLSEDREAISVEITNGYKAIPDSLRKGFIPQTKTPDMLWMLLRAQWNLMDRKQRDNFRAGIIQMLGYPVVEGSEKKGAEVLLSLSESATSKQMRQLIAPKIGAILEQLQDIPEPEESMMGFLIYDY